MFKLQLIWLVDSYKQQSIKKLATLLGETKWEPTDVFFALVLKNEVDFAGCDCDRHPANSYIEVSLCSLQKEDNKLEDGSDKWAQNSIQLFKDNMTDYACIWQL